jgi:hypothetical protein
VWGIVPVSMMYICEEHRKWTIWWHIVHLHANSASSWCTSRSCVISKFGKLDFL